MGTKDTGWGTLHGVTGDGSEPLRLVGPIYLRSATASCTRCDALTPVHTLVASDVVDLGERGECASYVYGLTEVPSQIAGEVRRLAPKLKLAKLNGEAQKTLLNHCTHCGAAIDALFLHEVPDGPFHGRPPAGHFGAVLHKEDVLVKSASYSG